MVVTEGWDTSLGTLGFAVVRLVDVVDRATDVDVKVLMDDAELVEDDIAAGLSVR